MIAAFQLILLFISGVICKEITLTTYVEAAVNTCFYESAKIGDILEVQFEVVNAGHGDYEIGLIVYDPKNNVLVVDFKRTSSVHRIEVKITGDHKICFDNTVSLSTRKTVYFTMYVENDDDDDDDSIEVKDLRPEENYEIKVEEIQNAVKGVHHRLNKAKHFQDQIKAHEARDRSIAEHNYERVNWFSVISIIVMLTVGMIQIFMVRSLFEERSKMHKIFKVLS